MKALTLTNRSLHHLHRTRRAIRFMTPLPPRAAGPLLRSGVEPRNWLGVGGGEIRGPLWLAAALVLVLTLAMVALSLVGVMLR